MANSVFLNRRKQTFEPLWVGLGIFAVLAVCVLALFLHYVPFDGPSYAAWSGIGVSFIGLVCLIKPLRFLGVRTRKRAALLWAAGVLLAAIGVSWPASLTQASGPPQRLDDFLSEYQFVEYHEARTDAPRAKVLEAVRQVSVADMPTATFLLRVRAVAGGDFSTPPPPDPRPILDVLDKPDSGFLALDVSNPAEIVYGMVGKPWVNEPPPKVTTPEQFLEFDEPGQIKVAFNIRVVDEGDGISRISTETRIVGNDDEARRVFARYWRIIYPGSAIIRRVWLDAIVDRAGC